MAVVSDLYSAEVIRGSDQRWIKADHKLER